MKKFLVLLVLAYARSEKLDLTYLPPPGSQYAGGRPEDIQVPLEFPKETYTTTLRPQDFDGGVTNPEDYQPTIGINRGLPTGTLDVGDVTPGSKAPFSYNQNKYKVPTTTVSYAFTQTTTGPPIEGFETTIGPQFAGTGIPNQDLLNSFQPQYPGFTYQENLDQPGYQQTQVVGQRPTIRPVSQYPGYPAQPQSSGISGINQPASNLGSDFQQNISQIGGQGPLAPTTGPVTQFTGSTAQPGSGAIYEEGFQAQNTPGFKPAGNEFGYQNPTSAPNYGTINQFPVMPTQNLGISGEDLYGQQQNQPQSGYQQSISGVRPGTPFGNTQYQNATLNEGGFVNQPGFAPSTTSPQGFVSTVGPSTSYGNRVSQGSSTPRPGVPQSNLPNQIGVGQIINDENSYQQLYPGSQTNGEPTTIGNIENVFQPSSTVAPTFAPGIQDGQFSTGSSVVPGSYSTPAYPDAQYNNLSGGEPTIYRQRPERPQADADRNAVILNYENVITPEGFAYSFDTSNGIHADESGTVTDGVKAKGSYSYIGDDGKLYSVVYTADENGYQPQGDHLPTPPPIPKAIQEIIEKVKKEKEAGIYHDGSYDEDKYGYKKYQGAMRYEPQGPKKVLQNDADIPEEYVTETALQGIKQRKPMSSTRKPIISSGDLSDFDDDVQEQTQYGIKKYGSKDDETPQISTQRPIDRVAASNEQDDNGNIQDGSDQNQYIEVSSKRPLKQPFRKLINKVKGSNSDETEKYVDTGRPGDKTGDQASFEYGSEEPYYEDDDSNTRFSNNGPSRRPTNQQRPEYGQEDTTLMDNFEYNNVSKRPISPGSFKRPVINAPENTNEEIFDTRKYETTRPAAKFPGRRPTNRPVIGNVQDQSKYGERYTTQKGSSRPSNKPFEYSDKDESRVVTNDYGNEKFVTKSPAKISPAGTKLITSNSRDQTISNRRRPAYVPETPNNQNENEYQPEDGFSEFENVLSKKYGNRRPIAGKPASTVGGDEEEVTEHVSYENTPDGGYYNGLQPTSSPKLDRLRPQTSRPRGKPQSSIQDNRGQVLIGDKSSNVPGANFGQKLIKPSINQQNVQVENVDDQRLTNETGYQYIPPQRKFEQDEVRRFPAKNTGTNRVTSTRRPILQNEFYDKGNIKGKPFMTPNVSRDDSGISEDYYDQEEGTPEFVSGAVQKQQNLESGTTPDQIFGDEIISSTKPPSKFTSSTYGPYPTTSRPLKPQYNQYTQIRPGFENSVVQKGNRRPIQDTDRTNGYEYTKKPIGVVSSTTPMPSTKPYYETTHGSTTPVEQNNYVSGNTYKTPDQEFISSTTPLPSQKPGGNYQKNTYEPQYQSTFRPAGTLRPTTEYIDGTTAQKLPTVSSTYSTSNVGPYNTQSGSKLPSTTYRPNFTISGANEPTSTAIPGVVVDGFGRPIRPGYSPTVQDYTPGSTPSAQPVNGQNTVRYQASVPSNEQRGQQRYRPGVRPVQQEVTPTFQSTTPQIIGEDFSGPKQQQKFDPETGYYY